MLHIQASLSFQEMVTSLFFLRGDGWPVSVAGGVLDASAPRFEREDPVVIVDRTRRQFEEDGDEIPVLKSARKLLRIKCRISFAFLSLCSRVSLVVKFNNDLVQLWRDLILIDF